MKRRTLVFSTALVATLGLAGCGGGELTVPDTNQSASVSPNLDEERISSALAKVQETLNSADEALNGDVFDGRISGGAARMREAQYAYSVASGEAVPQLDLTPQTIAVTNSSQWPRAIVNIRQADTSQLPVIEMLVQNDARSEYSLVAWARMLGGTSLTTPAVTKGSAYVTNDTEGFVMTPGDAAQAYVDMLNASLSSNENFASDEFTSKYLDTASALNSSLAAAGNVTASASLTDNPVSGVVLEDGSALVATTFSYTLTYSRTVAGSTMRLGGQTATMNAGDDDSVKGTAVATYVATVMMNIPSSEQGGVARIIGAERVLESVTMDESTNPGN